MNTSIRATIASEINSHSEQAAAKANEAMHHAIEAGKLLLEVKASLAHGQFGEWLENNVKVSARQAQRYMAAAEGKPVPIRSLSSKYDTVSHLPELPMTSTKTDTPTGWPVPTWTPTPGHWMYTKADDAVWCVVPSINHPGFFHVSRFPEPNWEDGEIFCDCTKRPARADVVEPVLQHFGMKEPSKQAWESRPHPGLSRPFADPEAGLDAMQEAMNSLFPESSKLLELFDEIFNERSIVKK